MRKLTLIALVLAGALFLAPTARGQNFTTVTGTTVDPNGIPYASGSVSATLIPASTGGYRLGGQPYSGQIAGGTLDGTGTFVLNFGSNTAILPAGTQWRITVSSNPGGIPLPLGTGAQSFTITATITGASQNISAALTAAAPKLTNFLSPGGVTSISATGPIVVTPNPITGVGTVSCPTCATAVGGGSISGTATQIGVFSGVNTLGGSANLRSTNPGEMDQNVDSNVAFARTLTDTTSLAQFQEFLNGGVNSQYSYTVYSDNGMANFCTYTLGPGGGSVVEWQIICNVPGGAVNSSDIFSDNVGNITFAAGLGSGTRRSITQLGTLKITSPGSGLISSDPPTISSGFGTTPTMVAGQTNGTATFQVTIGTGGIATTGVIAFPVGVATTGWHLFCSDNTTQNAAVARTQQIGTGTTTTTTIGNFTDLGVAGPWVAGDIVACSAFAF